MGKPMLSIPRFKLEKVHSKHIQERAALERIFCNEFYVELPELLHIPSLSEANTLSVTSSLMTERADALSVQDSRLTSYGLEGELARQQKPLMHFFSTARTTWAS